MKTSTQRIEINLSDEDMARIKHLQTELHIRQKTALVKLALLKLEEAVKKEKEINRAIKGYAKFPESEEEIEPFLKLSVGTIEPEDW